MAVIIWSLVVILVSLALAQLLRYVLKRLLPVDTFKLVDEFLASFQNSVCILELSVVSELFGFRSWVFIASVYVFSVLKHATFIRGKYIANPACFIDSFYNAGKTGIHSPFFIVSIVVAQISAALLAHPFVKLLWGRTYSTFHHNFIFADCRTSLEVTFIYGFFVEIFTTFVAWSSDYFTPLKVKPLVRSAVSLWLAVMFQGTSGVWMNPAVASAHTFNCTGHSNAWEHVVTYWLGPFIAVILFYEIKEFINTLKKSENPRLKVNGVSDHIYENDSVDNGIMLTTCSKPGTPTKKSAVEEIMPTDHSQNKYHRSPGGSLRPRKQPNIGPG